MNRQQTFDLFQQGAEAWNAWADDMLSKKQDLQESGDWDDGAESTWNETTRSWHQQAKANFWKRTFDGPVEFVRFRFPGEAFFARSRFTDGANFSSAEFHHTVNFSRVRFEGFAHFKNTEFRETATFTHAAFPDHLMIENATFSGVFRFLAATISRFASISGSVFSAHALFGQSSFEVPLHITQTEFRKGANFKAVHGKGLFLRDVSFAQLPSFVGADFEAAPEFDIVELDPGRLNKLARQQSGSDFPADWRALRRLAAQGHDHECEIQFLTGEIIARRGTIDTWSRPRFWAGLLYEVLSDFGRSMALPVLWLAAGIWVFAGIYASHNPELAEAPYGQEVPCTSGSGSTRTAAWVLSVHNAFPFAGIGSSGNLERTYACLYGMHSQDPSEQEPMLWASSPNIPASVAFLGAIQFLLSAVLIFLLVLAIRNWFRIK